MIRAAALALGQLDDPRFRAVLLRGVGLAVLLLAVASGALLWLLAWALPDTVSLPWVGPVTWIGPAAEWAAVPVVLLLSVFLMVPVASAMTSLFLEEVAEAVERRHYPRLPPARPVGWGESLRESAGAFGVALLANVLALGASLLLPPFAPLIFLGINGWLLGREYFGVVALRRNDAAAVAGLRRRFGLRIWALGALMAVPLLVPVLNLLVPTLGAAAFTHLYHRLPRR